MSELKNSTLQDCNLYQCFENKTVYEWANLARHMERQLNAYIPLYYRCCIIYYNSFPPVFTLCLPT